MRVAWRKDRVRNRLYSTSTKIYRSLDTSEVTRCTRFNAIIAQVRYLNRGRCRICTSTRASICSCRTCLWKCAPNAGWNTMTAERSKRPSAISMRSTGTRRARTACSKCPSRRPRPWHRSPLRDNTERPETITIGTNELIGTDPIKLPPALGRLMAAQWSPTALAYSAEVESATKAGQPWSHSYLQRNQPKLQCRRVEERRDPAEMGRQGGRADCTVSRKCAGITEQVSSMEGKNNDSRPLFISPACPTKEKQCANARPDPLSSGY